MLKIKLPLHRNRKESPEIDGTKTPIPFVSLRNKHRLSSTTALALVAILTLSAIFAAFPQRALASGGGVKITEKITFSNGFPIKDTTDNVTLTGPNNSYSATKATSTFTQKGNVGTATVTFTSVSNSNNQKKSPVPSGAYTATAGYSNKAVTVTVNGAGNGSATITDNFTCQISYGLSTCGGAQSIHDAGSVNSVCLGVGACAPVTGGPIIQGGAASNTTGQGGGGGGSTPTCESNGFSLSWIFCPLIEGMAKAVDGVYANFVQPLLVTRPVQLTDMANDPTHTYQIWSNFRVFGDIFLIIALLVVVFGQSLGGGLIDAYSAKKILPRLLIAAVLINLSIYIIALAVDVTNILGDGVGALIEAPFKQAGAFHISLNGGTSGIGLTALVGGGIWAYASLGPLMEFMFVFVLFPALLTFIAILATVLIRRGLILFLILISPIAFALYCLPNTEQYFKKWWDLLLKTLLIYPIIAIIFALANVLSITINTAGQTSGVSATLSDFLSIIALIIPLFLIPYSFKLAGGAIGTLHDTLTGMRQKAHEGFKGNINDPNSRQNRARNRLADRNIRTRERGVSAIGSLSKSQHRSVRALGSRWSPLGMIGRGLNSGDLEYSRSELNKRENEKRETKTGYGPDSSVRALFAEKGSDGIWRSRINGATFSDLEVAKAHQLHGKGAGLSSTQAALNYEIGKAGNDEEYDRLMTMAPYMMESMGYKENEIKSVMKGVGFGAAAKRLDAKHTSYTKNADGTWSRKVNYAAFSQDAAENFGTYPMSNFKTSPIETLHAAYDQAEVAHERGRQARATATQEVAAQGLTGQAATDHIDNAVETAYANAGFGPSDDGIKGSVLAQRTTEDVKSSVQTLDTRLSRGETVGETDDGTPVGGGTGAPGRVNDSIRDLIGHVKRSEQAKQQGRGQTNPQMPGQGELF